MYRKYFAWSFDDGLEQDKKIIATLEKYGMGATFHLNSGLFGQKTFVRRIGNVAIMETPADAFVAAKKHLLPHVPHFRIPEDEVVQVYEGFEVAAHSRTHPNLEKCGAGQRDAEITMDVEALSARFGRQIVGFAYPYGAGARQSASKLQHAGIRYARTVSLAPDFRFPPDPLCMPITCPAISPKALPLLEHFIRRKAETEDLFFLMFAHGYEFDFGTKEGSWDKFRRICKRVSSQEDIVCCSIKDALHAHGESIRRC